MDVDVAFGALLACGGRRKWKAGCCAVKVASRKRERGVFDPGWTLSDQTVEQCSAVVAERRAGVGMCLEDMRACALRESGDPAGHVTHHGTPLLEPISATWVILISAPAHGKVTASWQRPCTAKPHSRATTETHELVSELCKEVAKHAAPPYPGSGDPGAGDPCGVRNAQARCKSQHMK
jgi:hypothetical protein